jgi:hypothetical protein
MCPRKVPASTSLRRWFELGGRKRFVTDSAIMFSMHRGEAG